MVNQRKVDGFKKEVKFLQKELNELAMESIRQITLGEFVEARKTLDAGVAAKAKLEMMENTIELAEELMKG